MKKILFGIVLLIFLISCSPKQVENIKKIEVLEKRIDTLKTDLQIEREARQSADFDLWRNAMVSDDDTAFKLINMNCEEDMNVGLTQKIREKFPIKETLFFHNSIQFNWNFPDGRVGWTYIYIEKNNTSNKYNCFCKIDGIEIKGCYNFGEILSETLE